jgi:hypothetical protein
LFCLWAEKQNFTPIKISVNITVVSPQGLSHHDGGAQYPMTEMAVLVLADDWSGKQRITHNGKMGLVLEDRSFSTGQH